MFVNLPIGSGKSLCYFVLPLAFDCLRHCDTNPKSIALVVSPLIALMKDQVKTLQQRGADEEAREQIHNGEFQLLFISPEAVLTNPEWRDMLQSPVYQENLVAFAVDEAHYVKKWGEHSDESFRILERLGALLILKLE